MQEHEVKTIELKFATVVSHEVVAVAKLTQPATLQTPEVPYIQIQLRNTQPLLIPYDSEEERDSEYDIVKESMKTTNG